MCKGSVIFPSCFQTLLIIELYIVLLQEFLDEGVTLEKGEMIDVDHSSPEHDLGFKS